MDPTTDPALRSWIEVLPDSHFPIQNLPYGVFSEGKQRPSIGVAIGDMVVNLNALAEAGLLKCLDANKSPFDLLADADDFTPLLVNEPKFWRPLRAEVSQLLRHDEPSLRDNAKIRERALVHQSKVQMHKPCTIPNYTDFYSSREHSTNVGTMLRGAQNALQPNWLHLPVAYHGRASSIVVSGTDIRRPCGQTKADDAPA